MLYPTTCVGLRYGFPCNMLSGFSREYGYLLYQPAPKGGPYYCASAHGHPYRKRTHVVG